MNLLVQRGQINTSLKFEKKSTNIHSSEFLHTQIIIWTSNIKILLSLLPNRWRCETGKQIIKKYSAYTLNEIKYYKKKIPEILDTSFLVSKEEVELVLLN